MVVKVLIKLTCLLRCYLHAYIALEGTCVSLKQSSSQQDRLWFFCQNVQVSMIFTTTSGSIEPPHVKVLRETFRLENKNPSTFVHSLDEQLLVQVCVCAQQ